MSVGDPEEQRDHAKLLRQQAEDAIIGKQVDLTGMHSDDFQYLLHELQVHQAELSIQNEELRRAQLDLEISRDLYSDLYNFAPIGYCTLGQKGRILNANQTLAEMLGVNQEDLFHCLLSDFVDSTSQDEYYLHCQRVIKDHRREVCEIRLVKQSGEKIIARIESAIARGNPSQLMVMLSDITGQRRFEAKQQEYAAKMELQRRLMEQSEKERGELARNLHDGPLQSLTGLGFSLQILKESLNACGVDEDEHIQQMRDNIKDLAAELRGICNDLRPPVLSRFGLRRALQEHADEFRMKYEHPKIILELTDDPTQLPEPITLALYRIYQQALSNIIHHAKASEMRVRMKFDPHQVLFEIQDNGQGFHTPVDWNEFARKAHLGIVGMKERAEAIGGTFQLISQPDEGTLIQVIVPYVLYDVI